MKTTTTKRIFSLVLAVLMLLPIFTLFIFADDVTITNKPQNIARAADITIEEGLKWNGWDPKYLTDGDATTGTYSPRGREYAIALNFERPYYFADFSVAVNREGTLPDVPVPEHFTETAKLKVVAYNGTNVVYESAAVDVTDTLLVQINKEADKIVVSAPELSERPGACSDIYEIEAYSRTTPETCDSVTKNVASEAIIGAVQRGKNDAGEEIFTDVSWWAMNIPALTDGDVHTGTSSPKRANFIIQLDYGSERNFSSVKIATNSYGTVANQGTPGIKKDEKGEIIEQSTHYVSYNVTVYAYDYNDDLVYESDLVDVSSLEDVTFNIGTRAAIIRIEVSGAGNAGYSGVAFMWEVEAYEEIGSHALEESNKENPTCAAPGYIEYTCQDPECAYKKENEVAFTKKSVVPKTNFHTYDDGITITEPTDEANGVKLHTCKVCAQTVERDIPATNHNWDAGTTYKNDCVKDGYTEYKCTDDGCDLSYKTDFVAAYGHNFDDGVVKKVATTTEKGLLVYTCLRDGCGGTQDKILRKARYTDSTFAVTNSIVTKYESVQTSNTSLAEDAFQVLGKYVFDGITNEGVNGLGEPCNYWFAPGVRTEETVTDADGNVVNGTDGKPLKKEIRKSGLLYIYLDREYYFTKGTVYVAANYRWFEVHFEYKDADGNWVRTATYAHDRLDNGVKVGGLDMTGSLKGGARASRIVVESVNGNSGATYATSPDNSPAAGGTLQIHELVLEAHKCALTKDNYEDEAKWNNATCTSDGSCKATCPVCGITQTITLDKETYGHTYGAQEVVYEASCSLAGLAKEKCTECDFVRESVVIPPTGEHDYTKTITYMEPTCNTPGIARIVCKECLRPSTDVAIPATGIHVNDWIEKSVANYTKEGETVHACVYCGTLSGEHDSRITEKLPIPENFVTFQGYELRMTDFVGVRAKFKYDLTALEELQKTCDVTITVNVTATDGETKSVVVFGKNGTQKYNAETGEFAVVIKASNCLDEFSFSYDIKLRNFRGTVVNNYSVEDGETISAYDIAKNELDNNTSLSAAVKALYQEIVAEKK